MKYHNRIRRRVASGFTLLEMVIVLGIIAVLLGGSIALIGGIGDSAKIQRVEGDFNAIGSALKAYKLNAGNYPTQQQGLKALVEKPSSTPVPRRWTKVMDNMPQDPWMNDYGYWYPGRKDKSEFELISKGKDGKEGTEDDLSSQDPSSDARSGGFTLLEIVVVLLVVALIAGGAFAMMALSRDERTLGDATSEVESLAKRARTIAGLQQRPYALEFYEGRISMMPLAEAMMEPERRAAAAEALEAGAKLEGSRYNSERASWTAEDGTDIYIRRWASDEFVPITGKNREVWRFDPEGPCEPVTVRFQIGKSWMEAEFNPLTASIRGLPAKEIH